MSILPTGRSVISIVMWYSAALRQRGHFRAGDVDIGTRWKPALSPGETGLRHAADAETGDPEQTAGEMVKALVALKSGVETSEALRKDLLVQARALLGPAVMAKDMTVR